MRMRTVAVMLSFISLVGCVLAEDDRSPIGPGNPSSAYCAKLGYTSSTSDAGQSLCNFFDGGSCEQWSFYRAECGRPHSYCARQGGQISNVTTETSSTAICTFDGGVRCTEAEFSKSGHCP